MSRLFAKIIAGIGLLGILSCHSTSKFSYLRATQMNKLGTEKLAFLTGQVVEEKGNQMPLLGSKKNKAIPYKTQVIVLKLTAVDALSGREGQWVKQINSLVSVAIANTDDLGNYTLRLPEGTYSIMVAYKGGYFFPFVDQKNRVAPVYVKQGQPTTLDIMINSNAVY